MEIVISHPSDSKVQREIEEMIVQSLSKKENCNFMKKVKIKGIKFEFDFYNEEKKIIGEVYAGIENISSGSIKKIITDCFKLVYAEKLLGYKCSKKLVFIDEKIKKKFEGNSWISFAIKEYGIQIHLELLNNLEMEKLKNARIQQQTNNKKITI
jgi:hypothetical protein